MSSPLIDFTTETNTGLGSWVEGGIAWNVFNGALTVHETHDAVVVPNTALTNQALADFEFIDHEESSIEATYLMGTSDDFFAGLHLGWLDEALTTSLYLSYQMGAWQIACGATVLDTYSAGWAELAGRVIQMTRTIVGDDTVLTVWIDGVERMSGSIATTSASAADLPYVALFAGNTGTDPNASPRLQQIQFIDNAASVVIESPNGGETVGTNETVTIDGTVSGESTAVDIYAAEDFDPEDPESATWELVAADVAVASGEFTYAWEGPRDAGTTYGIRVEAADDSEIVDYSDDVFTAVESTITVGTIDFTPMASRVATVTWTTTGVGGNVSVLLSLDGGSTYPHTLRTGVPASQGYASFSTASSYIGSNRKIKVLDAEGTEAVSDAFTIVAKTQDTLQPLVVHGSDEDITLPSASGSGPVPNYWLAFPPNEDASGTYTAGVSAIAGKPTGKIEPLLNIKRVKVRVHDGATSGPWADIVQPSLNASDNVTAPAQWTPDEYVYDDPDLNEFLPLQGWWHRCDMTQFAQGTVVTFQYVIETHTGRTVVVEGSVIARPAARTTLHISTATGSSGGTGAVGSKIDTLTNAMLKAEALGVLNSLEIVSHDGGHKMSTSGLAGAVNNTRHIIIRAAEGAWNNTRIIEPDVNDFWQVAGTTALTIRIDFEPQTFSTGWGIAVTNQNGTILLDGAEEYGPAPDQPQCGYFNGFTILRRRSYTHDTNGGWGGTDKQFTGVLHQNCYALRTTGITGGWSSVVQNFRAREGKQYLYGQSLTFTADATANTITTNQAMYRWAPGIRVDLSSTGTLPAGLTGTMWTRPNGTTTIPALYPTQADAVNNTNAVDIQDTGSGTHTITVYLDVHSGTFSATDVDNQVVIGAITDRMYRPYAILTAPPTVTRSFTNCDFGYYDGDVNGPGIYGDSCLLQYCHVRHGADFDELTNSQVHANLLDFLSGHMDEESFTYNAYGNASVGTGAIDIADLSYEVDARTPAAADDDWWSGLITWPYGAKSEERGTYTSGITAMGPYPKVSEYTDPDPGEEEPGESPTSVFRGRPHPGSLRYRRPLTQIGA